MNKQDALLVALNALQAIDDEHPYPIAKHAIVQISRVLTQPEQEPVAWLSSPNFIEQETIEERPRRVWFECNAGVGIPLYTAPPKREWVGLTDEEIAQTVGSPIDEVYLVDFRRVIEKLRSKNT
jgi:hypothetical protein